MRWWGREATLTALTLTLTLTLTLALTLTVTLILRGVSILGGALVDKPPTDPRYSERVQEGGRDDTAGASTAHLGHIAVKTYDITERPQGVGSAAVNPTEADQIIFGSPNPYLNPNPNPNPNPDPDPNPDADRKRNRNPNQVTTPTPATISRATGAAPRVRAPRTSPRSAARRARGRRRCTCARR